jgi:tetratricopeptide (TPR) repeat protein
MAKISLRVYNREIESLIERGQTEEAIAHCKSILKTYSKHLDTYRLLGKAYLESQRYSEAADILRRILSVQPDDFVAQIGMSIIREDEGNLDAAIYHMERAFEIQPSNAAIQDELRRLYGRRDGLEPPKLRMTRGALVRMYAHGDLYRQAIAEARATLKEDPQRLDLEIVLAKMYHLTGQKAEAAEICSRLVTRLPFCLEANHILAEVLPETSRAKEAKNYQQKLVSLDPYYAYLTETILDPKQVPDNAVSLDRLEWTPSLENEQQPAWANSLGIQIAEDEQDKTPDWLGAIPSEKDAASSLSIPTDQIFSEEPSLFEQPSNQIDQGAEQVKSEDIPDWMRSAGWGVNDHPVEEQPVSYEEEPESDIAAPANLPDWLKEMAPSQEAAAPASEEEQQKLEWLASILPGESASAPKVEQAASLPPVRDYEEKEAAPLGGDDLPDWFNPPVSSTQETPTAVTKDESIPDWLRESVDLPVTPAASAPIQPKEETLPDWMTSSAELPDIQAAPSDLEWLTSFDEPTSASPVEPTSETSGPINQEISPLEESSFPTSVTPTAGQNAGADLSNSDQDMAWLGNLTAKQGTEEEPLLTRPTDQLEAPPDWVTQAPMAEENQIETLPDWTTQAPIAEEKQTEAAFEWDVQVPATEENQVEPLPEWVSPVPVAEEKSTFVQSEPVAQVEPSPSEASAQSDMDDAFSWLESLAAKQGAESGSLLLAEADRQEVAPEWVQQHTPEVEAAEIPVTASIQEAAELPVTASIQEAAELPVMEFIQEEPALPQTETEKMDIDSSFIVTLPSAEITVQKDEEIPFVSTPVSQFTAEEKNQPTPAPSETSAAADQAMDDAFSWLESLAAKQGAETGSLLLAEADRQEAPPDWVQQHTPEETELPETPPTEVVAESPVISVSEPEKIIESLPLPTPPVAEERIVEEEAIATQPVVIPQMTESVPPEGPVEVKAAPSGSSNQTDMDDAFAWLESLAAKQGAEADSLLVAPDDRQEAPPDWVQQQPVEPEVPQSPTKAEVSTEPAAAQSTAEQPVPAEFSQSPDASLPDWLKGLDPSAETSIEIPGAAPEKVEPPTKEASQASETAISDWIRGLDEEKKPEPPPTPVKPEPPVEKPPVERRRLSRDFGHTRPLPSWLTSTTPPPAPEKPAPAPEPVTPAEEHPLPDWLREEKADSSEPPLMVPTASSSDEGPALPDWLKNIGTEPEEPLAVTPILNPILQPILPLPALEISAEPAEMLRQAQLELAKGHIDRALLVYDRLIQLEQHLEEIIHDLRDALYRYPVEISIWQTLGDAYIRNNRVQDALDAYTKAEELLR